MTSFPAFLAFSSGMSFVFFGIVVVIFLLGHPKDRHRTLRISVSVLLSAVVLKAIHDGDIRASFELYSFSAIWAVGLYAMLNLVIWFTRARRVQVDRLLNHPLCDVCPYHAAEKYPQEERRAE